MNFLLWLEDSALVDWLITTTWVYPWVISFHSIGMGFLVGILCVISLRVLGIGRFPLAPLGKFLLIVRVAFTVSLATGIVLFVLDAQRFFLSPTFQIKMLLIVVAAASGVVLSRAIFGGNGAIASTGDAPPAIKAIAAVSLVCWAGAIVAGRLTAYLP